jgi:hypothetical protein
MTINFDENYNNKLSNKYIFTIRKFDKKYTNGEICKILIKHKYQFEAKIIDMKIDYFFNVKSLEFYLDCEKDFLKAKKLFYSFGIKDDDMIVYLILERIGYDYDID